MKELSKRLKKAGWANYVRDGFMWLPYFGCTGSEVKDNETVKAECKHLIRDKTQRTCAEKFSKLIKGCESKLKFISGAEWTYRQCKK